MVFHLNNTFQNNKSKIEESEFIKLSQMLVKNYYGAPSVGASPTLFYSMPSPGVNALTTTLAPQTLSAALAAAAAGVGGGPANLSQGVNGTLMASHQLSAAHQLSQSHMAAASHLSNQLSAAAAAHQQLTTQYAVCHQQQQQQLHHHHHLRTSPRQKVQITQKSGLSFSSSLTSAPSLTPTSVTTSSPSSMTSSSNSSHKKFRPPYTKPSNRSNRYIPKPMPQELGHLKTYSSPDILICGNCREMFSDLVDLIDHKKDYCKLRFTCKCDYLNFDEESNDETSCEKPNAKEDSTSFRGTHRPKWLHCVSCKTPFSNAWDLMVHVQSAHMMNIYQLADPSKPNASTSDTSCLTQTSTSPTLVDMNPTL